MLTPADLKTFIDQNDINGEIVYLDTPTPTVETAAQAVGTDPKHIVKSVLFTINDQHVLAITNGLRLIERRVIAGRYEVGRKRVKLSPPDIVLAITGYPIGTVPPFGHTNPLTVLIDPHVLEMQEIYAGGGAHNALIRLNPGDILRITKAEVLDLHNPPVSTAKGNSIPGHAHLTD
jgi:prolyl-tRNA editing enzyme YbaK/EbsC (Cys-tRNA(Pro) deacylase)